MFVLFFLLLRSITMMTFCEPVGGDSLERWKKSHETVTTFHPAIKQGQRQYPTRSESENGGHVTRKKRIIEGRRKNGRDEVFLDNDDEENVLPYGHPDRTDGLLKNTECDWMIPVDDCVGPCNIMSPSTSSHVCTYLFVSFDESRIELRLPGTDVIGKDSHEDCVWSVEVYDGITISDLFVGNFCAFQEKGKVGQMYFISTASSMVLKFLPLSIEATRSVFFQAIEKWRYHPEQAEFIGSSQCDWLFRSSRSTSGDLHTPDFYLNEATTCHYKFLCDSEADARELQIILQVNIFFRFKKHEGEACEETLTLTDGDQQIEKFCISEVIEDVHHRYHFTHNSSFHWAAITFQRITKQLSNPEPTWINYKFRRKGTKQLQTSTSSTIQATDSASKVQWLPWLPSCLPASAALFLMEFQTEAIRTTIE